MQPRTFKVHQIICKFLIITIILILLCNCPTASVGYFHAQPIIHDETLNCTNDAASFETPLERQQRLSFFQSRILKLQNLRFVDTEYKVHAIFTVFNLKSCLDMILLF